MVTILFHAEIIGPILRRICEEWDMTLKTRHEVKGGKGDKAQIASSELLEPPLNHKAIVLFYIRYNAI